MILSYDLKLKLPHFTLHAQAEIAEPGLYFVRGASGSGKTSFFKSLIGLASTSIFEGEVLQNGFKKPDPTTIGYLPSEKQLFSHLNPKQLLAKIPPIQPLFQDQELFDILKLDHKRVQTPCSKLSHGEKERVLLAATLKRNAPIQLWDEAFSSIPKKLTDSILTTVLPPLLQQKRALFWASHQIEWAYRYSRAILEIQQNRLQPPEPIERWSQREGLYNLLTVEHLEKDLWKSEFGTFKKKLPQGWKKTIKARLLLPIHATHLSLKKQVFDSFNLWKIPIQKKSSHQERLTLNGKITLTVDQQSRELNSQALCFWHPQSAQLFPLF